MATLAETRERYEDTPRTIDAELRRRARGDRGCLYDLVAGLGVLSGVACGLLYLGGAAPLWSLSIPGLLLAVGFAVGTISQTKSGRVRRRALESGPLVAAYLVARDPALDKPQGGTARAVALFSVAESHRLDRGYLRRAAQAISVWEPGDADAARDQIARLVQDPRGIAFLRVPEGGAVDADTWIADLVVYPERLEEGCVPAKEPVVTAIVDPARSFIEHA